MPYWRCDIGDFGKPDIIEILSYHPEICPGCYQDLMETIRTRLDYQIIRDHTDDEKVRWHSTLNVTIRKVIWIEEDIPVILRYKTARRGYLQVACRENGIKGYSKMKRKEMIQALMKI
jgi:hypothetical protein